MARRDIAKVFTKGRRSSKLLPESVATSKPNPEDQTLMVTESIAEHTHGSGWRDYYRMAFAPLRRFLCKQAGRKWDDVWHELCQNCDDRNNEGRETRRYALGMVELNTERRADGKIYSVGNRFSHITCLSDASGYRSSIYVDPEGLLRVQPQKARLKRDELVAGEMKRKGIVPIVEGSSKLQKLKGIWYMIEYKMVDDPLVTPTISRFTGRRNRVDQVERVIEKRQLNSKELKAHGLENDRK